MFLFTQSENLIWLERNTRQTEAVPLLFEILGTSEFTLFGFKASGSSLKLRWWIGMAEITEWKLKVLFQQQILASLWIISNIQSSNQCEIFKKFLYQSSGGNWESKCRTSNLLIPKFFHREDLDSLHCTTCSWLLWKRGNTFCKLMQILFEKKFKQFLQFAEILFAN